MAEQSKQTILGHLEDLRRRLMWIAIAVVAGTAVSFVFAEDIIETFKAVSDDVTLQAIDPTETIVTYFKLAFTCGIAVATPVILFEIVLFVRPALTVQEKRYLYGLLPAVLLAFAGGVAFAYFVLLPPAIDFLFEFGKDVAQAEWRISRYITLITRLLFGVGICFELPIAMFFLAKIGIVDVGKLKRFRRWVIVLAFVVSAFITPTPDPVNQSIVAIPLIILYELGIILAWIAQRGRTS